MTRAFSQLDIKMKSLLKDKDLVFNHIKRKVKVDKKPKLKPYLRRRA
jgi:hypothetical protein